MSLKTSCAAPSEPFELLEKEHIVHLSMRPLEHGIPISGVVSTLKEMRSNGGESGYAIPEDLAKVLY
jgi:hypothetical protein